MPCALAIDALRLCTVLLSPHPATAQYQLQTTRLFQIRHRAGLAVDILAGGLTPSHLALWSQVARASGGAAILQEGFQGLLSSNLAAAITRRAGTQLQLDFACSNKLSVEKVVGPETTPARRDLGSAGPAGRWQGAWGSIRTAAGRNAGSLEEGQCFGVYLRSDRDFEGRHVLVQAIARWLTPGGSPITRVRSEA